jgi:2-methylisocitrate lyase-like PEP mutase family enzyme
MDKMATPARSTAGAAFRRLLQEEKCLATPGVQDPLTARICEQVGFKALAIGGFSVEASLLGFPDIGLITLKEMADHAANIARSVDLPITCDVDTGFGGLHNIARTVREMERAGIAGIQIEDQTSPKRCPLLEGRTIVDIDEQLRRLKLACEARTDNDFVIIARSDADTISHDELVLRCNRYLQAGADVVMPITMQVEGRSFDALGADDQMDYLAKVVRSIDGPVKAPMTPAGYALSDMADIGFKIVGWPAVNLQAAASATLAVMEKLYATGSTEGYFDEEWKSAMGPTQIMKLMKIDHFLDIERRYI